MIGIAHDGDGDRVIMCDEEGEVVPGDQLLGILALNALSKGELVKKTFVATIQSNRGLDLAIEKAGGVVVRSNVGDRDLFQKMKEVGSIMGGEASGHIIFADYSKTGDGLLAGIKVIEAMRDTGRKLSDLRRDIPLLPQLTENIKIAERRRMEDMHILGGVVKGLQELLGREGRVLVRYSGTEPKIRLLVEGPDEEALVRGMKELKEAVSRELTVVD